ncbi:MAG: N-acetyltransferase [Nitrospirae bacterium]|nr:N-acetyltransferase [Nitrospirota bacterium]
MLARPLNALYENLRDYFVCEGPVSGLCGDAGIIDTGKITDTTRVVDTGGTTGAGVITDTADPAVGIIGVSALHIMWEDLAEIKSLAVSQSFQKRGIGRQLLERCLDEARALGVMRIFALTYVPGFFKKLGFTEIDKSNLPHKIWGECIHCTKFPDCDEQAVILEF